MRSQRKKMKNRKIWREIGEKKPKKLGNFKKNENTENTTQIKND